MTAATYSLIEFTAIRKAHVSLLRIMSELEEILTLDIDPIFQIAELGKQLAVVRASLAVLGSDVGSLFIRKHVEILWGSKKWVRF